VLTISAPRLLRAGTLTGPGAVVLDEGVIHDVLDEVPAPGPDHIALDSGVLTPGLVDIQINGAYGVDFSTAADDEWAHVAATLPGTGVTAYLPTFITAPLAHLTERLDATARLRDLLPPGRHARCLGAHLEGPFLSHARPGVHEVSYLTEPSNAAIDTLLADEDTRKVLTMVTLAPELPGAVAAIRRFTSLGVRVSIGHTDARGVDVTAAADAGATLVTHIFNAQRGLAHREPGVPGAALVDPRYRCGLIADMHHVVPEICTLIWNAAPGRVVLVTDAMAAAGMAPGRYELAGIPVTLANGVPRRDDGTLAGSTLTLDAAVRNMIGIGLDPAGVLDAASRIPADAIGRPELGRIAPGATADLVWWNDDFTVQRTWIGGLEH
jgi:N-acetylglucosamine-6-phosphate deacetylase